MHEAVETIQEVRIGDTSHSSRSAVGGYSGHDRVSFPKSVPPQGGALRQSFVQHRESWRFAVPVLRLRLEDSLSHPSAVWEVALEETSLYPKKFRITVGALGQNTRRIAAVLCDEHRVLWVDPPSVELQQLPESVFGAVVGAAFGLREYGAAFEAMSASIVQKERSDMLPETWHAPQHILHLHTAHGSPMAERWGVSIRRSSHHRLTRFLVVVEQLRTGREYSVGPWDAEAGASGIEWSNVSALPAAVHGAVAGLLAVPHALESVQMRDRAAGEVAEDSALRAAGEGRLPRLSIEEREALETELQEYVSIVRAQQARKPEKA